MSGVWAGYTRVSRVGDRGDRLISPELQADEIKRWAKARGVRVKLLDPELDESGGRLDRPILERVLAGIDQGRYAGIVVARLDRLSRSLPHSLHLFERVEAAGGQIVAVAEQIDATTPAGRMQRNMLFTIGNYQLDRYRADFAAAKASAVMRGVWPTNTPPIGYRRGRDRRLQPDPSARKRVVRAFEQRAAGAPWSQVADTLGVSTSGAGRVIRNRVYLGELKLGEVVNPTAHPALVPIDLWQAAQQSHPRPPRGTAGPALLAGLVRCAGCGRTMTADSSSGRGLYRCHPRNATGRCKRPAIISQAVLHPHVEQIVVDALAGIQVHAAARRDRLSQALDKLRAAEAELDAYQRATSAAGDPAMFASGLRERVTAVEQARSDVGASRNVAELRLPGGNLEAVWQRLGVQERRHVLRGALGVVWVRKGRGEVAQRVRVIARGFEPPDLSRPGFARQRPVAAVAWPNGDLPGEIRPASTEHVE